jgi:hypothetical protein
MDLTWTIVNVAAICADVLIGRYSGSFAPTGYLMPSESSQEPSALKNLQGGALNNHFVRQFVRVISCFREMFLEYPAQLFDDCAKSVKGMIFPDFACQFPRKCLP